MTSRGHGWPATLAVVGIAAVLRIIAWPLQAELTYDGAYYVREAERLAQFDYDIVSFPPGYPAAIALLRLVLGDAVRAARAVSLLCGLATILLTHRGLMRSLGARWALAGALFLAVHPQLARLHVEALSESLYGLLLVAGILWHGRSRFVASAAALGAAFLVRPEAIAALAGVTWARVVATRTMPWSVIVGWLPVTAYAIAASFAVGHPVLSPKQDQLDLGAGVGVRALALASAVRLTFPWLLLPVAWWWAWRTRRLWLWIVIPSLVLPLAFSVHVQERLFLPAVPFLTVLVLEWCSTLGRRTRVVALGVSLALFVPDAVQGYRSLFWGENLSPHAREIGTALRPYLKPGDRLACRFPMIATFAGVDFVRPQALAYDALLDSLYSDGATHLAVVEHDTQRSIPQLAGLFSNQWAAAAESRLEAVAQIDAGPGARAVLYRFVVPSRDEVAIPGVRDACWSDGGWVMVRDDGDLYRLQADSAPALIARTPEVESEPHGYSDNARIVVCQTGDAERWIARRDPDGVFVPYPATAADDPASPADAGTHVVYLRRAAPAGLRCVEFATGRIRTVRLAGVDAASAQPLAVTVRGRDIAITYRETNAQSPHERVVATATWNATSGVGDVILDGRWAIRVPLADDRVDWFGDEDRVLAAVRTGSDQNPSTGLAALSRDGSMRRFTFGATAVRAPCSGSGGRVAFLDERRTLHTAVLAPSAVAASRSLVFAPTP